MNQEKVEVKRILDQVAEYWDHSGHFVLHRGSDQLYYGYHGFEDRLLKKKTSLTTRYLMDSKEQFFVGIAILMAVDEGLLDLSEALVTYLPEWPNGGGITLEHLLRGKSGLVDFYHGQLMVESEGHSDLSQLSDLERLVKERCLLYEHRDYPQVHNRIKDLPLDFEPGSNDGYSETNVVVLDEVFNRVVGETVLDYLKRKLFVPYDFQTLDYSNSCETLSCLVHQRRTFVAVPIDFSVEGLFSMSCDDAIRLMTLLKERKILSDPLWQVVLSYDDKGEGILFSNANGYDVISTQFLGFGLHMYFDFKKDIAFASLINEDQTFKMVDNVWRYFRRDAREAVASVMTYPSDTRMVKVNEKNFWDVMSISIREDQQEYVMDAKGSLAMGLFYETKEVFVQMEGDIVVGLLVLEVDPKKDFYHISIIIIDHKFQNKGFGKHMVDWAVSYLKNAGARKLSIGVNRDNIAAKKVYMKAGFEIKSVYDGGMALEKTL